MDEPRPSSGRDETSLVVAARARDRAAFNELALRCYARIASFCLKRGIERSDIPDLAQDIMIQVWGALPDLDDPEAFSGWFLKIVKRTCFDAQKRSKNVLQGAMSLDQITTDIGRGAIGASVVTAPFERKETREAIGSYIRSLPAGPMREVVWRHYVEHQPVLRIVRETGIRENTVLSHLRRFRDRHGASLKELLD